jgi:hypothetical protein
MSIIDDLTPKHFKLVRFGIQREGGGAVRDSDVLILNAAGEQLRTVHPKPTITSGEKQALKGIIDRNLDAYATATGLTEWVEPEPPEEP